MYHYYLIVTPGESFILCSQTETKFIPNSEITANSIPFRRSSTMSDKSLTLFALIQKEPPALPSVFKVIVSADAMVADLQDAIKKKKEHELEQYDADSLILWKARHLHSPLKSFQLTSWQLNKPELIKPFKRLGERVRLLGSDLSDFAGELEPTDTIAEAFPENLSPKHLHIIVQPPLGACGSPFLCLFVDAHFYFFIESALLLTSFPTVMLPNLCHICPSSTWWRAWWPIIVQGPTGECPRSGPL